MTSRTFDLAGFFQALGDPTRLRLLNLLHEQEVCVCYFVDVLGAPQPKISRHLAYLRRAGIVSSRREGKWMHYRLVVPAHSAAAQLLADTLNALLQEKSMQADRARLVRACCSSKKHGRSGAPQPAPLSALCCEARA